MPPPDCQKTGDIPTRHEARDHVTNVKCVYDGAVFCIHSPGTGTQSRHTAEHSSARRAICSDTPTHPTRMLKHSDTSPCKFLLPLVSMSKKVDSPPPDVHPWPRLGGSSVLLSFGVDNEAGRSQAPGTRPPEAG